jgi:asparagine synthase (glutamine-hydrolysing)
LDSHAVVKGYIGELTGRVVDPEVMQKIPYMEMQLRIPEHLLMRVDKMTMAHSIEARVPFLDHDLVEFAMRVPPSYKLSNGVGKSSKMAERYVDPDSTAASRASGRPGQVVSDPNFGRAASQRWNNPTSTARASLNRDYVMGLLRGQVGAPLIAALSLTVMNAVFGTSAGPVSSGRWPDAS